MAGDLDNLRVVLVATRNPLNIGAAARAMSNFGVRRLRVVNPYEPAFREARSAVGAAGLLAKAEQYDGVAEAVYYQKYTPQLQGAMFYHATYIRPDWAKDKQRVARIGRHVFYK